MKHLSTTKQILSFILLIFLLSTCSMQNSSNFQAYEDRLFDSGWKFKKGDIAQAELPEFDDSDFRNLSLPHDWSIEFNSIQDEDHIGPFVKGIKDSTSTGNIEGGIGWYRKHFAIEDYEVDNTVYIYFDGVSVQSEVWINGHHLGFHPNGYTPFYYDLTEYLNPPGEENVLAVKTVNTGDNSRWFPGSGLYRHVWLSVSKPVHIKPWSVFITTPEVTPESSQVQVSVTVRNDTKKASEITINTTLYDSEGTIAGSSEHTELCDAGQELSPTLTFNIDNVRLWSPDAPHIYKAVVNITSDGKPSDTRQTKFGIRSLSFSPEKGFLLNGKETLLKGACIHHDNGLLGSATFDRAEIRRVESLKMNGFNAIRTAHNLPSAQFLDACDSLGMLVIDEVFDMWVHPKRENDYHLYFEEWSDRDLSAMILRDRNHPSVIAWSIGNEIFERADSSGLAIGKRLVSVAKTLDTTRPVTQAICALWQIPSQHWDATIPAFALLDVGCYNYEWKHYERDHQLHPDRVMIGTESFPKEAYINWYMMTEKPYVIGDFVWTGIDYIGEVGIGNTRYGNHDENDIPVRPWPWYLSWCGDIDICGDKKPQSYYRDVIWDESEIEILVHSPVPEGKTELVSKWGWPDEYPHWNWNGLEGTPLKVTAYTKYDTVRLYLNESLIGECVVQKGKGASELPVLQSGNNPTQKEIPMAASFMAPYKPGTLKAVAIQNGKEVASKILETSGKPAKIMLIAEQQSVYPNPNDLVYVRIEITDDEGRLVPDAEVNIQLSIEGSGKLIACGNAAPDDLKSFSNPNLKTFRGRALAILQPGDKSGMMSLTAKANQFADTNVEITIE